jgi:hypothetical protein
MDIRATLLPGQEGTRQLLKVYGDQLVCVRYRYDKARQKRLKTVELIVDEQEWVPGVLIRPERRVHVRVGYGENELRAAVKRAGGYWDAERKAWLLEFSEVVALGLEARVVDGFGFWFLHLEARYLHL